MTHTSPRWPWAKLSTLPSIPRSPTNDFTENPRPNSREMSPILSWKCTISKKPRIHSWVVPPKFEVYPVVNEKGCRSLKWWSHEGQYVVGTKQLEDLIPLRLLTLWSRCEYSRMYTNCRRWSVYLKRARACILYSTKSWWSIKEGKYISGPQAKQELTSKVLDLRRNQDRLPLTISLHVPVPQDGKF